MLMAGLDGIENKIDPGEPMDKNIYDLEPKEAAKVPNVPGSLDEALDYLEKDHRVSAQRGCVHARTLWRCGSATSGQGARCRCACVRIPTSSSSTTTCRAGC